MPKLLGWIWAGDQSELKHGYPCLKEGRMRALCDVRVTNLDQGVDTECPNCGAMIPYDARYFKRLHRMPPDRAIITREEALEQKRRNEPPWQPPPPLSPKMEAEMEELSKLLR